MKGQEQDFSITGKVEPCKQTPILKTRKIYIHKSKLLHSSKQYSGGHKRISYVVLLSIDGSEEYFCDLHIFCSMLPLTKLMRIFVSYQKSSWLYC